MYVTSGFGEYEVTHPSGPTPAVFVFKNPWIAPHVNSKPLTHHTAATFCNQLAHETTETFSTGLDDPESFKTAIEGCIGVFHIAPFAGDTGQINSQYSNMTLCFNSKCRLHFDGSNRTEAIFMESYVISKTLTKRAVLLEFSEKHGMEVCCFILGLCAVLLRKLIQKAINCHVSQQRSSCSLDLTSITELKKLSLMQFNAVKKRVICCNYWFLAFSLYV
ncbi:hypothetical protein PanWU01x14_237810 [Parasponia andersonii]|uniref:Uncharacterized protein n=1 Tax=Parasponia andersonii TaxID=3476 RepID=A0A2P5BHZ5_PARAD|nr:hypothetical protein PanWU01x14_237810 [Parasponia andersonii]